MSRMGYQDLRRLVDSLDPVALAQLKILVNARTRPEPKPPTDGPETYRGIPVPESLHRNWDQHEAAWWTAGVRAALASMTGLYGTGEQPKPSRDPFNPDADPFAPDLTMSPEVADFILRAVNGLLLEGYWPKAYTVDGRYGDRDQDGFDVDMVRKAADLVGRDKVKNTDLRKFIAELDEDARDGAS